MSTLRILNSRGDTAVSWAPAAVTENDTEALAAVAEAERIFADALKQGATAFSAVFSAAVVRLRTTNTAE